MNKASDENMQLHSFGGNQSEVISKTEIVKEQPEVIDQGVYDARKLFSCSKIIDEIFHKRQMKVDAER